MKTSLLHIFIPAILVIIIGITIFIFFDIKQHFQGPRGGDAFVYEDIKGGLYYGYLY